MKQNVQIKRPKIAVIAGDGIGKEVMPEGVKALVAADKNLILACNLITLILPVVTTIFSTAK